MVKNYKKLPKKKQEEICRKERERYHRNKEADEAADAKKKKLSRESSRRHREKKRRENELSVTNPTMTPVTPSKSKSKSRQLTRVGTPNTTGRKLVGRVKTPHNTDRQLASRADTPNTTGRQVVASGTTIDHLLLATNDPKEAMGLMNMWGRIAAQNTLQSAAESNKDITEASRANMEKFLAGDDAPDDGKDEDYTNDDLDDIKNGNLFANVAGSRKKTVSFASTDGDSDEDSYVFKE